MPGMRSAHSEEPLTKLVRAKMYAYVDRAHKRRRAAIVLGILLACGLCASALDPSLDISQYAHTAWKVREGFSKGAINAIAQTPDGYLWLGTDFGLLRFDGVRTVAWEPRGNERLPSNVVRSLLVSRDGSLWIGTHKGLASWKDGKLTQYSEVPGQPVDTLLEVLKEPYGQAWRRFPPGDSARFKMEESSATETMAASAWEWVPYLRIARAISGQERGPGCGNGSPAPRNAFRCQARPPKSTL